MTGGQGVKPAPADCGTVNPDAKVITLHGHGGADPGGPRFRQGRR